LYVSAQNTIKTNTRYLFLPDHSILRSLETVTLATHEMLRIKQPLKLGVLSATSGFRREVDYTCALLGCYAAYGVLALSAIHNAEYPSTDLIYEHRN
jgi:hypothetical protein